MAEVSRLICVRVADMNVPPAEGSMEMECESCGSAVWVARSSQEMLVSGTPYKLACMQCAKEPAGA